MPFDENGIWVNDPTPPVFPNDPPPQALATTRGTRINWAEAMDPRRPPAPQRPGADDHLETLTEYTVRRAEDNHRERERQRRLAEAAVRRIKAKEREMKNNPYNNPELYGLRIIYKHEEQTKAPNWNGSRHRFLALVVFKNEIKNEFLGAAGASDKAREYMFSGCRLHNLDRIMWPDWKNGNIAAWNGLKTFKTEQIKELEKALQKEGFKDWDFQQNPDFEQLDDDDNNDFDEEDDADGDDNGDIGTF